MTKKILKIACILILILCTFWTSKSYANGAYYEEGDVIKLDRRVATHGNKSGYVTSTFEYPKSSGKMVTLSGKFWCMDYGKTWNTQMGDWIPIHWNKTKNIPDGKDISATINNPDWAAYLLYNPDSNSDDNMYANKMQQEFWKHIFEKDPQGHTKGWCTESSYKKYKNYLDKIRNTSNDGWDYIFPIFEKDSSYKEEIIGDYKYLGPFSIEVRSIGIDFHDEDGWQTPSFSGLKEINVKTRNNSAFQIVDNNKSEMYKWDLEYFPANQYMQPIKSFWIKIPKGDYCTEVSATAYANELYLQTAIECIPQNHAKYQKQFWGSAGIKTKEKTKTIELQTNPDPINYTLTINKYGSDTGNNKLSGAVFTITETSTKKASSYPKTITGNSNGTFKFNSAGTYTYTISETTAPTFYNKVNNVTLTVVVALNTSTNSCYVSSASINSVSGASFNNSNGTLNITDQRIPPDPVNYTLTVNKYGSDTGNNKLNGSKFRITGTGYDKTIDGNSSAKFTFNKTGTYTYTIQETTFPKGYVSKKEVKVTLTIVVGYNESTNKYVISSAKTNNISGTSFSNGTLNITNQVILPTDYKFTVKKVEEGTTTALPKAVFTVTDEKGAQVGRGTTNANGNIEFTIKIVDEGTHRYTIKETTNPKGYVLPAGTSTLTLVTGVNDAGTHYVVKSKSISGLGTLSGDTLKVENKHETISISGTAWLDQKHIVNKTGVYNGQIDSDERQRISGVEVKLKQGNNVIQTATTNSSGTYTFNNVRVSDVFGDKNYYVEFTYDGMTYTTTIYDNSPSNGKQTSKADETATLRSTFNGKFKEYVPGQVTGTAGNINLNYNITQGNTNKYAEAKLNTSGEQFKLQVNTPSFEAQQGKNISNVNLGLIARNQADFSLQQGIKDLKATINGTETTITKNIADTYTADEIKEYLVQRNQTRTYNIKNSDYTYRIGDYKYISNNQKNANQSEELELYITYMIAVKNTGDVVGTVNEIKNYYSNTYTITNVETTGSKKINYTNSGETNGYKCITIKANELGEIAKGGIKWIYVTYKVNKNNNTNRNIITGNKAVITEINKYTTYSNNNDEKYSKGVADKNSAPGNLNVTADISTHENDTAKAPTLNITKNGSLRTVTGTVWDDENSDGRKNENKPVNGVIVQLVEIYKGQEFIWKEMETGTDKVDYIGFAGGKQTANVSKSNGTYKFEDFIPGEYILRFKYGETEKTVRLQNGKSYNGHEYESTVFGTDSKAQDRSDRRAEVLNSTKTVNNKLGKLLVAPYNNPTNQDIQDLIRLTKMTADTNGMKIDTESVGLGEINFGIKARTKDNITVEKNISHITVTLNNGTLFADVNYSINEQGKAVIEGTGADKIFNVPESPWVQMDNEIINGATLKIKYNIKVTNNSNDNTITGVKLIDYLPENMKIDYSANNGWEAVDKGTLSSILDENIISKVQSAGKIMITNTEEIRLNPKGTKVLDLESTITLSPDMDTYNYTNIAEIIKYTSEKGRRNSEGIPGNQDPTESADTTININEKDVDKSEKLVITKNTGGNKPAEEAAKYYYFIGIMIQITIIAVVAFVKKYKM